LGAKYKPIFHEKLNKNDRKSKVGWVLSFGLEPLSRASVVAPLGWELDFLVAASLLYFFQREALKTAYSPLQGGKFAKQIGGLARAARP
jgi:hypothetical protein